MSAAYDRLVRWRDVGDVSITYTAGDKEFGDDVTVLLIERAELLTAAKKLEEAEAFHLACEECEGQEQPEICGHCFPLYDDARVMRRNAIAKAPHRTNAPEGEMTMRDTIIAEIMKLVRPEPVPRAKPTIAELEAILNSETQEAVNINSDGSVSVCPTVTTVGAVADAILAALSAQEWQDISNSAEGWDRN